jgi:hypothetical protein
LEARVNHALRSVWQLLGIVWHPLRWRGVVRAALDRHARIDPDLERLAERAFAELRQAPLIRPTGDIAEMVKQRLQQRSVDQPGSSDRLPTDEP